MQKKTNDRCLATNVISGKESYSHLHYTGEIKSNLPSFGRSLTATFFIGNKTTATLWENKMISMPNFICDICNSD